MMPFSIVAMRWRMGIHQQQGKVLIFYYLCVHVFERNLTLEHLANNDKHHAMVLHSRYFLALNVYSSLTCLPYSTTHYGPELPDDATQIGERDDTASGGCGEPTRDDVTQQQAVSGFGNTTRQQDDHTANNLSSTNTSATASPVSQRRRRRLRRRLQDIGPTIASTRPRRNNVAYTFPPMGQTFRRWTTEEVNALDDGIKLYGKQWGRIIAEYSILRTSKTKEQAARKARYIAKQRKLKGLPLEHYEGCG